MCGFFEMPDGATLHNSLHLLDSIVFFDSCQGAALQLGSITILGNLRPANILDYVLKRYDPKRTFRVIFGNIYSFSAFRHFFIL